MNDIKYIEVAEIYYSLFHVLTFFGTQCIIVEPF